MFRYLSLFALSLITLTAHAADNTSAYDRVMKDHVLRCGYISWPPYFSKDVKTGETTGLYKEYFDAFGQAFGIKVEWTSEISMTDIPSALNSGKIDAFCLPLGAVPTRAVNMEFSRPVVFYPFYPFVRKDDTRFDKSADAINSAGVTLSTMEGEYTGILARTSFPKAKLLEITEMQGSPTLFANVATKKADVIFQDPGTFGEYEKKNPNILKKAGIGLVGAVPGGFIVKLGDDKMKRLFDYGVSDLQNRFILHRLLVQYKFIGEKGKDAALLEPTPDYLLK